MDETFISFKYLRKFLLLEGVRVALKPSILTRDCSSDILALINKDFGDNLMVAS